MATSFGVGLMIKRDWHSPALDLRSQGFSHRQISKKLDVARSTIGDFFRAYDEQDKEEGPKILLTDIETSPLLSSCFGLFKQNIGINQIKEDWYVIAYCSKWLGDDEIIYNDKRDSWQSEDDSELVLELWHQLDEADIVIAHNALGFDIKKLNSRFVLNGLQPPSSYKVVDTLQIAKARFGFTSNKLEYLTSKLCTTYKKQNHKEYPGFELWKACLQGDPKAWECMEQYNKFDVLSLEELYLVLRAWDKRHPNINWYYDDTAVRCTCGSKDLEHNGYVHTGVSKFDRFRCNSCGNEVRGRVNLFSKEKRQSLKMNIPGV